MSCVHGPCSRFENNASECRNPNASVWIWIQGNWTWLIIWVMLWHHYSTNKLQEVGVFSMKNAYHRLDKEMHVSQSTQNYKLYSYMISHEAYQAYYKWGWGNFGLNSKKWGSRHRLLGNYTWSMHTEGLSLINNLCLSLSGHENFVKRHWTPRAKSTL